MKQRAADLQAKAIEEIDHMIYNLRAARIAILKHGARGYPHGVIATSSNKVDTCVAQAAMAATLYEDACEGGLVIPLVPPDPTEPP